MRIHKFKTWELKHLNSHWEIDFAITKCGRLVKAKYTDAFSKTVTCKVCGRNK